MSENKSELDIIQQVMVLNRLLKSDFDQRIASYELTSQQGRILFFVCKNCCEQKETHQNDIEKHFHLSKSSVSEIIQRMERNGLIQKKFQSPYSIITPSEKGASIAQAVYQGRIETINKLFSNFSSEEKNQIMKSIDKMTNNIRGDSNVAKD